MANMKASALGIHIPPEHKVYVPCILRKPQDEYYIDAAFRSTRTNEVFMFTGQHYLVVKYDAQSHSQKDKENKVTEGPLLLIDGFPELFDCPAFRDLGVDAAFGCHDTEEAFIFSRESAAKVTYQSNNKGWVHQLNAVRWLFNCLDDTEFIAGSLDAACESTVPGEAYLFKGFDYVLINYSKSILIRKGRITDEFTCLHNTDFGAEIGSAFATHTSNQLYFFKGNSYVLIEFDSETKKSSIIAGPEEIVPTNWPCLREHVPYNKKALKPIGSKTYKSVEHDPKSYCSFERSSFGSKRNVEDYALDATMTSGSSSKRMKTVENQHYMQVGTRYSSHYIDAAFRSIRDYEVFMFIGHEYFVVKYDVDSQKPKIVTKDPRLLTYGFEKLSNTRFSSHGVDAAFGCHKTNAAFLFSGSRIAKIKYDTNNEGWVECMYPSLKDTKFCQENLDAACESTEPGEAYLFKGSYYALINYPELSLIREGCITDEFTCLRKTVFESEIGAAFASHKSNHLYFFKNEIYVLIEFDSKTKKSRIIAGPEEIAPTNGLLFERFFALLPSLSGQDFVQV